MRTTAISRIEIEAVSDSLLGELRKKHPYTYAHCLSVERYAFLLASRVAYAWTAEEIGFLRLSARLHDIGKLRIDTAILDGTGKLTDQQFTQIKTHPQAGIRILAETGWLFPPIVLDGVRCHHLTFSRFGNGYPDGPWGEDIPFAARIVAVADVFDALRSDRSYQPAFTLEDSMRILMSESGKKLDPYLTRAFIQHVIPELT